MLPPVHKMSQRASPTTAPPRYRWILPEIGSYPNNMIWLTTSHIYLYIYTSLTTSLTYVTISLTISHVIWLTYIPNISSGWWFGTFFLFSIIYGMSSSPWTNSYVSRWLKPPTSIITIIIIIIYYYYGVKPLCLGRLSRVQDGSLGNCYYIPNYIPWPSGNLT